MTRDLLWAVRRLRKNPLFTAAVVAILALGIGANTAVFGIIDAVLLRPLPYASADRLVRVEQSSVKRPTVGATAADYLLWRDRTDLFEKIAAYRMDVVTLTGTGDPDQLTAIRTSPGLFSMLGVRAETGRTLVEADDQIGGPNPAVDQRPAMAPLIPRQSRRHREFPDALRRAFYHCRRDAARI